MKKVLILGSTGSIGINTLNVIRNFPEEFEITALTVNTRIDLLEPQINEFNPDIVVVKNEKSGLELRKKIVKKCRVLTGEEGLVEAASSLDYDIFVGAMVGFSGLAPALEAIKRGKIIALAGNYSEHIKDKLNLENSSELLQYAIQWIQSENSK